MPASVNHSLHPSERKQQVKSRTLKFALATVTLAAFAVLVAPALSSRAPTASEKKAITHAFKTTHEAGLNKVASHFNVRRIRVSTVNTHWAKANLDAKKKFRSTFQSSYGVAKRGSH